MSHYIVSESLAGEIGSQFLTPPEGAQQTKWGKRWDTEAVIEDVVFKQDEENPKVESLRIVFRVPSDAMSNQGRGFSEFFNFHWDAVEEDSPANLVTRTKISYASLCRLMTALGAVDGPVSPGAVAEQTVDLQGRKVGVQVTIGPDKNGTTRQNLSQWKAA